MALPRGVMGCLRVVVVVFPDHTHLLFFGSLIAICRKQKPGNKLIMSAIILRAMDHLDTDPMISSVNSNLQKETSKSQNFQFIVHTSLLLIVAKFQRSSMLKDTLVFI